MQIPVLVKSMEMALRQYFYTRSIFRGSQIIQRFWMASIDTTTLYSKLTGSKKQKPVQMQQTSDRSVPLPPPMAELKKQLAYSNMRLRACRAGADVASDMQVWS